MARRKKLKVFVSHSHEDTDFCRTLVVALRQAGANVWYDEHNLGSGRLGPIIEREVRARPIFVVVLSPAALHSQWVEDETRWAYSLLRKDAKRIILPVTAAALQEEDVWLFLHDFKRVETSGLQPYPTAEAVQRTLHALHLTAADPSPAPTAPKAVESVDDLIAQGLSLRAEGKHAEALSVFQRATQLFPSAANVWLGAANTLFDLERYDEAHFAIGKAYALIYSEEQQ